MIDLKFDIDDYVVHENYGIGIFKGNKSIRIDDKIHEYLKITFADNATVSVPIKQKNLVHRYIGSSQNIKISKITSGNKDWVAKKKRAKKKIADMTMYLVDLYSKKKEVISRPILFNKQKQQQLEKNFEHSLTSDQKKVIGEIEKDLATNHLMDRIICGDVGFGKTEVALHVILQFVSLKKQVAFLVPTTLLAEQHHKNFLKRLTPFGIRIEVLNRFKSKKEIEKIFEKINQKSIDLVIGTHKIFNKDLKFSNLELLVIDEEHKFGVKQKELIRNQYNQIHTLSLTATPIPRTLHMSLVSIKKISTIKTPPPNRKSINTHVKKFDIDLIVKAIEEEKKREGQVFFIHNTIHNLDAIIQKVTEKLSKNITWAKVHGQMDEKSIQKTVYLFTDKKIDLIFSTTILESGIDIPNANTLIVNNAHLFGLSSLHQMRGRVGRSDIKGNAYFFYPPLQKINETAKERLLSIEQNSEVGDGFEIAKKDMEIRGIGSVFGAHQSGNIIEIGLELYSRLIKEAIEIKQK